MTGTKEKKDMRGYYLVEHYIEREVGEAEQKLTVVLEFNKAEALSAVKDKFREDVLPKLHISDPVPLDMSKVLTKIKLNKRYTQDWFHISGILSSYWKKLPQRKKGEVGKFYILKELPTQEEFNSLLITYYTDSAQTIYEEAKDDLEELKTEVEEWKDNIEENFSETDRFSQLEDALNCFEQYDLPDWPPENVPDFDVTYIHPVPKMYRGRPVRSRATRLSEARDKLQTVVDGLGEKKPEWCSAARRYAEKLEDYSDRIDELVQEMREKSDEAAEIREDWKTYQEELAEFKENHAENPEEYDEEPAEPNQSPDDAAALEDEVAKIEDKRAVLESVRSDYCTHRDIEPEIDPDDVESEVESFVEEIEQYKEEVEGVEFPGMFG